MLQRLLNGADVSHRPRVVRLRGRGRQADRRGGRRARPARPESQGNGPEAGRPHFDCHYARDGGWTAGRGEGKCDRESLYRVARPTCPLLRVRFEAFALCDLNVNIKNFRQNKSIDKSILVIWKTLRVQEFLPIIIVRAA